MIRIAHISDLHFGTDDETLIEPLQSALREAAPDVVAVSGDVTQRARTHQFRAARAFLDRLTAPWVCVPATMICRFTICQRAWCGLMRATGDISALILHRRSAQTG